MFILTSEAADIGVGFLVRTSCLELGTGIGGLASSLRHALPGVMHCRCF